MRPLCPAFSRTSTLRSHAVLPICDFSLPSTFGKSCLFACKAVGLHCGGTKEHAVARSKVICDIHWCLLQVQLQLVTATVKLFLKKPTERPQQMIQLVLTYATQETDNPDLRDRAYVYWWVTVPCS